MAITRYVQLTITVSPDIDYPRRLACHDLLHEEVGEQEVAEVVGAHMDLETVLRSTERLEIDT